MLYLSESSLIYGGERQLRADGSFDPEIPDRPSPQHQWSGTAWELELAPDWDSLTTQFQFPGNALYSAIAAQVAVSGFAAQDHWSNFKLMLLTPSLRSAEALAAGMNYLSFLLAQAGQTITPAIKSEWNALLAANQFPASCKLS